MTHLAYPLIVLLQLTNTIVSSTETSKSLPSTTTTLVDVPKERTVDVPKERTVDVPEKRTKDVPEKRTLMQEQVCGSLHFDATLFDHSIWNHVEVKSLRSNATEVIDEYHFSFCNLLGWHNSSSIPSECSNYHVCHVIKNVSHPAIYGYKDLKVYETPHKGLVYLMFMGDPGTNDTDCKAPQVPSVTISFTCDRKHGLGYPSKIVSSPCSAHFVWPTIAACSSEPPSKELPFKDTSSKNILSKCYTYDSNGDIRDLSPLIADDGYEVLSPPPVNSSVVSKKFFINVCSEVRKSCQNSRSSPDGTAVCSITPKGEDWRRPNIDHLAHVRKSTLHYEEDSEEVVLTYQGSSVIDYTCTHQTHIRFRCPTKSADVNIYGLESRKPFLVSSSECETVIEWETDHACPLHKLKGSMSTCIIEEDDLKIDLSPLKNLGPITVRNITSPDLNSSLTYDATIVICGSFPPDKKPCPKSDWQSDSVCITGSDGTAHLIGSKSPKLDGELSWNDGRITLLYPTNLNKNSLCKMTDASPVTTITFICDKETESNLTFLSTNPLCEFDFEVRTKHACVPPHLQVPTCSLEYNGSLFDLSPLRKKMHEYLWTASVNPFSFKSAYALNRDERILLNVCGAIPKAIRNNGTCIDLPSTSAACLYNGRTKESRNIGHFLNPPVYDPTLKAINLTYETTYERNNVKNGTEDVKNDVKRKKTITTITLRCTPGILDSSPVLVSRSEDVGQDSFHLEWSTSVACPLKTSSGSDCIVTDESLGYTFDLNPLRTEDPVVVLWNKYKFYLNVCGELHYNPCKKKDITAGICQFDPYTNETYVSGQANGNVTYYDGALKLTYVNGTKYRDPNTTPRTAEIIFICDEEDASVDQGKPKVQMVTESNRTYFFRWYTKHACPDFENIVPCLWTNGTHSIDLSPMSLVDSNHFEVSGIKRSTGSAHDRYYANICRPLNPIREPKSCRKGTAVCWYSVDSDGLETVTSLGIPSTPPDFHDGEYLSIYYKNGDPCFNSEEKKNTTWSSMITFLCDHSNSEAEFKIVESGECYKKIQMKTDLVCNITPTILTPSTTLVPTKYDSSDDTPYDDTPSSDHKKPGIIIITVIAFLVILFAIFILVNREVRTIVVFRIQSLICGEKGPSRSMYYSQLTSNDFNASADQVAFISGHSSLSPYNTTTTSIYGPSHKNGNSSTAPAQHNRTESADVPFSMYEDDDIDLLS